MTYGQCFELLCCLLFPLLLKRQKKRVKEKLDQSLLQVMIEFDHRFAVIQGKKHNGKGFFFFSVNRHDIQPKKKGGLQAGHRVQSIGNLPITVQTIMVKLSRRNEKQLNYAS